MYIDAHFSKGDSPVFVEAASALITDVLGEDGLEGPQTTGSLDVSHNSYDHHGRSLDNGDRFYHFLFVHLWKRFRNGQNRTPPFEQQKHDF